LKRLLSLNFIALFFLRLGHSNRYKAFKNKIRDLFTNPKNPYKRYIDYTIIFLIITSVAIMMYEVKSSIPWWLDFYAIYFTSFIFAIEYLIKMWIYNDIHEELLKEEQRNQFLGIKPKYTKVLIRAILKKLSFILTPSAIIDLLAIIPAYREFRFLKIFILFRFLKIFQHSKNITHFIDVLLDRKFELITLLVLLIFIVFVGGLSIYVLEEHINDNINDIFDALYWSFITITTVGYGDISPVSTVGRLVSFAIVLMGITMISFATSVIVSAFSEKLIELKEERIAETIATKENFLIICGYSHITKVFLRLLNKKYKNTDFIILDKDPQRVQEATNDGYPAICDDASRFEVINRFFSERSHITLFALTSSDIENIYITINAKSVSKDITVIARASGQKFFKRYKRAGADRIILPNDIASSMIALAILHSTTYKAINAILNFKDIATMDEVYVDENSKLVGKKIKDLELTKVTLIGIQNGLDGEFYFNPKKDYELKVGEILIVLGHKISIDYFKEQYNANQGYLQ